MRYEEMLAEMVREPWAMIPDRLASLCALISRAAGGDEVAQEEIEAKITNRQAEEIARADGRVVVIPVDGVITHRGSWWGVSAQKLSRDIQTYAADGSIKAIILDIDSPGGTVSGVEELASVIHAVRDKPVVAVANSMAASAAYWIASQASDLAVTPTGQVGSIGVYSMHLDMSRALDDIGFKVTLIHAGKHKVEGNPFQPLDDDSRAELQRSVDEYYGMFTAAVKRGRGNISEEVMQGRMYSAETAQAHRLVDRVATLEETIARYVGPLKPKGKRALTSAEIEAMRLQVL